MQKSEFIQIPYCIEVQYLGMRTFANNDDNILATYLPQTDICEGIPLLLLGEICILLTFLVPPTYLILSTIDDFRNVNVVCERPIRYIKVLWCPLGISSQTSTYVGLMQT